jgi:hypothetical protein
MYAFVSEDSDRFPSPDIEVRLLLLEAEVNPKTTTRLREPLRRTMGQVSWRIAIEADSSADGKSQV